MTYNTTALILSRRPFREADLRVTFFSRESGKGEAVAIGAKKTRSKLAGHLEPFREVKLMLARGRFFDKIGQAVTLNNFGVQTYNTADKLWRAQQAAETFGRLTALGQKDERLYELFKNFLILNFQPSFSKGLLTIFHLHLLDLSGLAPELKECVNCHCQINAESSHFNFARGGITCSACASSRAHEEHAPVSREIIRLWQYHRRRSLTAPTGWHPPASLAFELNKLVNQFLLYQF